MIVNCPKCGRECKELGNGQGRFKNEIYKYIYFCCEIHGEQTVSVKTDIPLPIPKRKGRRNWC